MIAGGLKAARSPDTLAKEWSYFAGCSLELVAPPGVPESRWGLDPVSFRVVRQLAASPTIQALLQANPDPSRKLELLQALELLFWVGLVELKAPTVKISEVKVPDVPARPVAIPVDTAKLEALKAALATMEKAHPAEVLELVGRKKATEDDVANAFREISRRYHPDLFFEAAPSVRKAAEACFTRINTFHEQAKTTDGLADINRFLDAKASGKQYISEKDHISARVAFKKGEIAWKNRDWVGAEPLFEEAFRLDPVTWPHQFFRIQARVLTKKMMMPQAVKELEALAAELNPRARPAEGQPVPSALQLRFQRAGEVLAAAGMLLKQAGKEAEAKVLFVRALEVDPENRDAQREARRQEKAAREEAEGGWMGRFWKK
jgi:tetratricopeptide (TPR) repeat protein